MYHRRRGNGAALNWKSKMKNFFCVGQKVIEVFHNRDLAKIVKIFPSGQIELDSGHIVYPDRVEPLEEDLDPTNYFYHHAQYGEAVAQINDHFSDLLYWKEEQKLETHEACLRGIINRIELAEMKLEKWLMIKRTAEHNICQWGSSETGYVMAQHMPFLNPENCQDYF